MVTHDDVRKIALALPDVVERTDRFGFDVVDRRRARAKPRGIAWLWRERVLPKKPKVPNPRVLVVCVRDEEEKHVLIAGDPSIYFTEPHYDGYNAVLVRLDAIGVRELRHVLHASWKLVAPPHLVAEHASPSSPSPRKKTKKTKAATKKAKKRKATSRRRGSSAR